MATCLALPFVRAPEKCARFRTRDAVNEPAVGNAANAANAKRKKRMISEVDVGSQRGDSGGFMLIPQDSKWAQRPCCSY